MRIAFRLLTVGILAGAQQRFGTFSNVTFIEVWSSGIGPKQFNSAERGSNESVLNRNGFVSTHQN